MRIRYYEYLSLSKRRYMNQMKRELENKLNELGVDCVRIGKDVLFDLNGKPVEAKVKEIIQSCRQHPKGAVVAESGDYTYMFDPAGAKIK